MIDKFSYIKLGDKIQKASIRAMNEAAKSAVAAASSFIRQKYKIKKEDLDLKLKLKNKASEEQPYVRIAVMENDISLYYFNAKQFGKPGRPKKGRAKSKTGGVKATVQLKKRKLYRSKDNKAGSFIWQDGEIVRGVFIRTGEKHIMSKGKFEGIEKEGIKKLFGVSLLQLFNPRLGTKSLVLEEMEAKFFEVYEKRLEHNLSRI
ncbi:MAG: phage tail protein [Candidatus Roizmanbacteria bacterium]|nr:phage tail protein [Candidatus Roizmanbacteria bacterium]